MRVLVCGGRNYLDVPKMWQVLGQLDIAEMCHGGASGADALAGHYASANAIPCSVYEAQWRSFCPACTATPSHRRARKFDSDGWEDFCPAQGGIRNQRMLNDFKPDLVVAFPGGKGTMDMCRRAAAAHVELRTV